MTTLRIQRGVPASGKTTDAKAWLKQDVNRVRVNRDDIRAMLGCFPMGNQEQENNVTAIEFASMEAALIAGNDVVNDATNLRSQNVTAMLKLAQKYDATVEFKDFPIGLDAAVRRDEDRAFDGLPAVGRDVITGFFKRYIRDGYNLPEPPSIDEAPVFELYVPDPELPHCILVDIDGTLAHMTNRGPYDTSKYTDDILDETVRNIVEAWFDRTQASIFIMSGRNEDHRGVTEQWLEDNGVFYDALFMRPSFDPSTKDSIVKNALFEAEVAGKYNVDFVLDDRDQVVKMWRAKGLKVLQVAEGSF